MTTADMNDTPSQSSTPLVPDETGFRYVLMWLDHILASDDKNADASYLAEWREFIAASQARIYDLEHANAEQAKRIEMYHACMNTLGCEELHQRAEKAESENAEQAELHRMQLTAIDVVSGCNTYGSLVQHKIEKDNPYWTPQYQAVFDAVEREIKERVAKEKAEQQLAEAQKDAYAGLHKLFDDAGLFTGISNDGGKTWQKYPIERRIAIAISVCKDESEAKEIEALREQLAEREAEIADLQALIAKDCTKLETRLAAIERAAGAGKVEE